MDAVKSVYAQTYENWEIVIIDDASTDNSHEILNELYIDKRIRIYLNDKNKGVGDTKYRLAALAQGELFAFLDADDRLEPNALEVMVMEHQKHPECSLISSNHRCLVGDDIVPPKVIVGPRKNESDDLLLCNGNRIHHIAVFKNSYYKKTKGAAFFFFLAEDLNMYYKMEEVGKIGFVDMPLYQYRIDNSNSISIGANKQSRGRYFVAVARLDAYMRRINSNSWRCDKFRNEYEDNILTEIIHLKNNRQRRFEPLILKFLWMYLRFMHFNMLSIKRSIRVLLYK